MELSVSRCGGFRGGGLSDLGNDAAKPMDRARLWRDPAFGGFDLLSASYVSHRFVPHAHQEFVIAAYEAGAEAFVCAGKPDVASAGCILVIRPGEVHSGYAAIQQGWQYRAFYPGQDVVEAIWQADGGMARLPRIETRLFDDAVLAARLSRVHRRIEQGSDRLQSEIELVASLAELLQRFGSRPQPRMILGESWKLRKARRHIEDAFRGEVGLSVLGDLTGLSAGYLTRRFHHLYGLPPHAYLTQIRLQEAKLLLRRGESQADIAAAVGFSDQSHLITQFKRAFGVTPGAYAREVKKIQFSTRSVSHADPGTGRLRRR